MKNKSDNSTVNFRCPVKLRDNFQKVYPYCLARFLCNALRMALIDKDFFERVYLTDFKED